MEKEVVRTTIKDFVAGNENLRVIMGTVSLCGQDIIKTWRETDTNRLIRMVSHATGILIRKKIGVGELLSLKEEYWETDDGKQVDLALEKYIEKVKVRKLVKNRQVEI
ncbi:MAG: hypothetical protein PHR98_00595 [Candidatus Shapirobacteria bacterium]|nr:hypothetical protein [Candidatus Shapirobacteria bacterium]